MAAIDRGEAYAAALAADAHWHAKHEASLSTGERFADNLARWVGSWPFVIWQNVAVSAWMLVNILAWVMQFDPYPFILLNLVFSWQAANTGPILQMTANRAAERDRHNAEEDYRVNREAERRIEDLQTHLHQIEDHKLDVLIAEVKALKELIIAA